MVFLLGVDHQVQQNRKNPLTPYFIEYAESVCQKQQIQLIAEEFSKEALKLSRVKTTTVFDLAARLGLPHLYCDPTTDERKRLGIGGQSNMREQVWLTRLNKHLDLNILFICGSTHLISFSTLLRATSIPVRVCRKTFDNC
jgi:hypothetical protein